MSSTGSILKRDLYILEDESNPLGSKADKVLPSTILDQVYDDQDPTQKTLRTIIEELKKAIETGGEVVINFPVTSVNGKRGDVVITKDMLGLDKVDNTSDGEKPLSDPQRATVMDILEHYTFDVDLHVLYEHIANTNNPHAVTFEQINSSGAVTELIQHMINTHDNDSRSHANLQERMDTIEHHMDEGIAAVDERVEAAISDIDRHYNDENAHSEIMDKKEDSFRKVPQITEDNTNYDNYPSTRATVEYVANAIIEYMNSSEFAGIEDIIVVRSRDNLPQASSRVFHRAYFILVGINGALEIAVCRKNNNVYEWDYTDTGIYSNLNRKYFNYEEDGLIVKSHEIGEDILNDSVFLEQLKQIVEDWDIGGGGGHMEDYYTKEEIDAKHFLTSIGIKPGTINGTIRFYINDDLETMSDDIHVSGLRTLAYKDKVTENDLEVQSVTADHIRDNSIENRHMTDKSVNASNMTASYMRVFGNVSDDENKTVQEITLRRLAELFAPVFREILEGTSLIQITEQTVRRIARQEVNYYNEDWLDPEKMVNFQYENPLLKLQYYEDMGGTPNLYFDENGQLCMDVVDTDQLTITERDLEHFTFYVNDGNLWVKIRSDEPDPEPEE